MKPIKIKLKKDVTEVVNEIPLYIESRPHITPPDGKNIQISKKSYKYLVKILTDIRYNQDIDLTSPAIALEIELGFRNSLRARVRMGQEKEAALKIKEEERLAQRKKFIEEEIAKERRELEEKDANTNYFDRAEV